MILSQWKLIAIVVLAGLLAITVKLWRHEVEAYATFRAEVAAEGEKARAHAAQIERQHDQITEEVSNAYARNIDALRAFYGRLQSRPGSSGMSGIPAAPARIDEIPADALPIAGQCAETTQQLIDLQEWLKQVGNTK